MCRLLPKADLHFTFDGGITPQFIYDEMMKDPQIFQQVADIICPQPGQMDSKESFIEYVNTVHQN